MSQYLKNNFKSGDLCLVVNPLVLSVNDYALVIERIFRSSSGSNKKGEYAYRCLINNKKEFYIGL